MKKTKVGKKASKTIKKLKREEGILFDPPLIPLQASDDSVNMISFSTWLNALERIGYSLNNVGVY
jgi:hypothetical protein